jgi:hypothetical protein
MIKSWERNIMVQKQKISQTSFLKKVKLNKLKCNFIKLNCSFKIGIQLKSCKGESWAPWFIVWNTGHKWQMSTPLFENITVVFDRKKGKSPFWNEISCLTLYLWNKKILRCGANVHETTIKQNSKIQSANGKQPSSSLQHGQMSTAGRSTCSPRSHINVMW